MSSSLLPDLRLNRILPIAELSPTHDHTKVIKAVVALIWPYSSSEKALSLLLVEADFRLRRNRGQVRVEFHDSSAREVANAKVSPGDEILLSLDGMECAGDEADMKAPGRGVDWKLIYRNRLFMQVDANPRPRTDDEH